MVELQQSQAQLEDGASIMDEASICSKVLGTSAGTMSGIGPASRKSYSSTTTASSSRVMLELETLAQRVNEKDSAITELTQRLDQTNNEKDSAISELTQRLEQQALLIQSLIARMDMSHEHPPVGPNIDPPPPPPSIGPVIQ